MYKETDMREKRGIKTNGFSNIETDIDGMKLKSVSVSICFLLRLCLRNMLRLY